MNKWKMKKKSPLHIVLDIVIAFLCVCTIGAVIFMVSRLNEDLNYSYDEESFYYRLQDEDYGQMVEMYHTNESAGVEADRELRQYYGIAEYFEAASYYKIYKEAGDEVQVNKYQAKMQEAEGKMGELSFVSDKICEKLGIE